MYLYLLTIDGKKDFSPTVIEKQSAKFVRKTNLFMDTERLNI